MSKITKIDSTPKPYKGFLKKAEPGSTVDAGRNIVTKRDIKYAQENGINLTNSGSSHQIKTSKSLRATSEAPEFLKSIGSAIKKGFKFIFK